MADYNSNYTGAEVDAAIAKTQEFFSNNTATAGDIVTADGSGGIAFVTPTTTILELYVTEITIKSNTTGIAGRILSTIPLFDTASYSFADLLTVLGASSAIFFSGMAVDINNGVRLPVAVLNSSSTYIQAMVYATDGSGYNQYMITTSSTGLDAYINASKKMFGQV